MKTVSIEELIKLDSNKFAAHKGYIYRHWFAPDSRGESLYQEARAKQKEVYGDLYDQCPEE